MRCDVDTTYLVLALIDSFDILHRWVKNSFSKIKKSQEYNQLLHFIYRNIIILLLQKRTKRDILKGFIHKYRHQFTLKKNTNCPKISDTHFLEELVYLKNKSLYWVRDFQIVLSYSTYKSLSRLFFDIGHPCMKRILRDKIRAKTNLKPTLGTHERNEDSVSYLKAKKEFEINTGEVLENHHLSGYSRLNRQKEKIESSINNLDMNPRYLYTTNHHRLTLDVEELRHKPYSYTDVWCCFYTLHNKHQHLNCMDITADASQICGGFNDDSIIISSLRQYSYNTRLKKRYHFQKNRFRNTNHFRTNQGPVYAVKYTDDRLFTASGLGYISLWDIETNSNLVTYRTTSKSVWDIAVSKQSHYIAAGCSDHTAKLWSIARTKPLRCLVGHKSDVDSIVWHTNPNLIVTGSNDCTVRLWDTRTAKSVRVLSNVSNPITSLAISPSGEVLGTGLLQGEVISWHLGEAKKIDVSKTNESPIWSLEFIGTRSSLLASGSHDGTVNLWDLSKKDYLAKTVNTSTPVYTLNASKRSLLIAGGPEKTNRSMEA
jgi:WD40 repeat protein